MKDARTWASVDVGYFDNLKMAEVFDASSNATLMHLASILFCAQHLTDGHAMPKQFMRRFGGTAEDIALLVNNGLWHEPGHDCPDCPQPESGRVYVHNFLDHNRSAEEAERLSSRGKRGAQARWGKDASSNATSTATSMQQAMPEAMLGDESSNALTDRQTNTPREPSVRRQPERPLPANWSPNDAHMAYAREKFLDLDTEAERFTLHAKANDRRQRDWDAAFRMWLTKARPTQPTKKNPLWD